MAEHIARGEAEIGIHQISEILPVKGITLIGPLPAHIQNYTVYAAGLGANVFILDVNPNGHRWVWAPAPALIRAMRTLDAVENRGYLLVREGK